MADALIHAIPNPASAVKGEEFDVCFWIDTLDNVGTKPRGGAGIPGGA
jgi:hypothetical protein